VWRRDLRIGGQASLTGGQHGRHPVAVQGRYEEPGQTAQRLQQRSLVPAAAKSFHEGCGGFLGLAHDDDVGHGCRGQRIGEG
jgi:hypothetical protein